MGGAASRANEVRENRKRSSQQQLSHEAELTVKAPMVATMVYRLPSDASQHMSEYSVDLEQWSRKHQKELTPLDLTTLDKCTMDIARIQRYSFLAASAPFCVYTATKWTYGHTFGTWRFLGLSGFATLASYTLSTVFIRMHALPGCLQAFAQLPTAMGSHLRKTIYSTAEEELAHSSLVLRIPHNHYGALGDITPFRHLNPRVFTVSPLPNYHSEDETVAAHVALQLHMHPHDVPAALHTPMPGGTMLNPAGAGTPQPASAVAPVLAVPAVAAAPGAPVAPALPGAAPALTPPSTEELAAAHVRRPRNWREWRREHAANAPAAPPAATPAENTADSSAKQ